MASVLGSALVVLAMTAAPGAQRGRAPAAPALPPISMTCPMHPEVVEARPGTCPLCRMNLVPVRLDSEWTCPLHSVVSEPRAGTCRICRRELIQVTVALTWTCPGRPDIDQIERGTCPDGAAMLPKRTLRPHGNHNAQHGGQFFMAPDNWHHLEGAYPQPRVFRLYLYDDYSRPLAADKLRLVEGRVVTRETFNAATRTTTEQAAFPLVLSPRGTHLEARVDAGATPAQMTAKVRLKRDAPEYRFDFTFPALSQEPAPARAAVAARERPRPASSPAPARTRVPAAPVREAPVVAAAPGAAPAPAPAPDASGSQPDPALVPLPIPETIDEIVVQVNVRKDQIADLIARGNFSAVFVPAFQAKDLAIALESRLDTLAPARREIAEPAIHALVRTAWLLDAVGDAGNRQQIADAYAAFTATVAQVTRAFSGAP